MSHKLGPCRTWQFAGPGTDKQFRGSRNGEDLKLTFPEKSHKRPDGFRGRGFKHLRLLGLYPVQETVPARLPHKIPGSLWPQVVEASKNKTLRELADEYAGSHESVRRTLVRANGAVTTKER